MNCPNCKIIEMRVESVNGAEAIHVCKKCGTKIIQEIPQRVDNKAE